MSYAEMLLSNLNKMRGLSHIAEEEEPGLESPQFSKKFMDVKARIYNKLFSS
jgi:hypothetical protein